MARIFNKLLQVFAASERKFAVVSDNKAYCDHANTFDSKLCDCTHHKKNIAQLNMALSSQATHSNCTLQHYIFKG